MDEKNEDELDKIKKKVAKICRVHRNQRAQRYLLIKPPKQPKKKEKLTEDRQSFSTLHYSLKYEKLQKKLLKILLKNICRTDPLMYYFDIWFNKTFNSDNYTPFSRNDISKSNSSLIKVQRKPSKAKKLKKSKKDENEIKNKTPDKNINANIKKEEFKNETNNTPYTVLTPDKTKKSHLIYIINNEHSGNTKNREAAKFAQIKEILNQDVDSESSDNKLLFNDKKKNVSVEPFDMSRKKSVGPSKKFQKNKLDNKTRIKEKESKKNKETKENKENKENKEKQRKQRK